MKLHVAALRKKVPNTVSAETSESQQSHSRDRPFDRTSDSTGDRPCNRTRARRADAVVLATDWLNQDHSGSKSADRHQVVVNIDVDILANKNQARPRSVSTKIPSGATTATGWITLWPLR